jgi:OOP family OmpA-OmpF porin
LAEKRAKAAFDGLVDNQVPKDQILYKGYGSRNPIATNTTKEGRALNRRVDIKIK